MCIYSAIWIVATCFESGLTLSCVCSYTGTDPSMLITNAIFRMGGAAILLSNRYDWHIEERLPDIIKHSQAPRLH